jgi:hypothetical protein
MAQSPAFFPSQDQIGSSRLFVSGLGSDLRLSIISLSRISVSAFASLSALNRFAVSDALTTMYPVPMLSDEKQNRAKRKTADAEPSEYLDFTANPS